MSLEHVIIVAGGVGARMGSATPKQFLMLAEKPIIVHTIEQFFRFNNSINVVVVLNKEFVNSWKTIHSKYLDSVKVTVVDGGASRTDSVLNGLKVINTSASDDIVAIHDAVRPLVDLDIISRSFDVARRKGSAVVSVTLKDSIREVDDTKSVSKDRSNYRLVQTPQVFRLESILHAYEEIDETRSYTDDASVYEASGGEIVLVEGAYSNLKITTPEDMLFAETIINNKR